MNNLNQEHNSINNNKYKKIIYLLLLIIAILLALLIYTSLKVRTIVIERTEIIEKNTSLQLELDNMLITHEQVKAEHSELAMQLMSKDSLIKANAEEIQKLISQQADYWKIKKQLRILRSITQGYVNQIDSLFTVNQALKDENLEIKKSYTQEKQRNIELVQEKEDLSQQVNIASTLKAYNVSANGIRLRGKNNREDNTNKAGKIDVIRICFTLSENKIVEPGNKTIYVRIARPDNKILVKGSDDIYSFIHNDQRIQYSLKKEINYQNKSQDICLSWEKADKKANAMTGTYNIAIFIDDYEIGQTNFIIE